MIGMKKPSPLATFGAAAAMSIASTAAVAQTIEPVSDSVRLVLVYLANNPLLFLSICLTAILIIGKSLDLIRSFRNRRQRPIEGLNDDSRPINERLRTLSGRQG